jgi:hypothetical protein
MTIAGPSTVRTTLPPACNEVATLWANKVVFRFAGKSIGEAVVSKRVEDEEGLCLTMYRLTGH